MEYTNNLKLPLLVPNQSGKEFTHNEALIILDNLLHSGIIAIVSEPPNVPTVGGKYLISTDPAGDFLDKENHIAVYDNGWRFIMPATGQIMWDMTLHKLMVFGENWEELTVNNADSRFDENFSIVNPQENDILSYSSGKFSNNGGLLTTLLNSKANFDFSNITSVAKKLVCNLSAPSSRSISISVGTTGSTYTAPANGYVSMLSTATGDQAIGILRNISADNLIQRFVIRYSNYSHGVFIPTAAGQIIQYEYSNMSINQLSFHYANGN
ncbi:MAG: DUF2793 domain-containing protein [Holosporaceae bacterium]|jgi:hypothetical protein|nr:DUF2793 domain-containing protein [Holosporaceae bacterium]